MSMISDITIGQYYKGNSLVHRLDARMKIILTILFIVMIFMCKNFLSLGFMFLFVVFSPPCFVISFFVSLLHIVTVFSFLFFL